ncbi:hypothetical protein BJV85_002987 [Clostridium acetobutylicum]|uniref:Predicted membrane protein n=1 Tax=Clostridium acetobutylicum (strain ATCC 824 / DSM 792 / JCM 1419 / IAM 19013 / LMG 5710 / NBRC 13948 / NRRL B-527 / VKM B-1787 / 2291 / W) TaxID=272562 RepID=Q97KA1_CLOAB|nr:MULTISPECIES: PQQ-dependent sugar dehydrogenase [Clostridium]AAK78994.1 Predicted membrane protein [Clostridium acetobutylicum ATCC 824]ADZ20069.1 membrane protein [Clostridium acetobutylicum EA 2018]AEI31558.1 hypothetical protein SMB_G1036 [Clostridium acetobutylicum DSM 1731]AWV81749.1 hypothetical protein DK921_16970 [Clostridium acetobutylicum]MBC2395292.1 hypothetical protein [Clostridium acetobutylicum]
MKKILKCIIFIVFVFAAISIIYKYIHNGYTVKCKDNNVKYLIKFKGVSNAVDFTEDENKNFYVAYKSGIQAIYRNGKTENILKSNDENIRCMVYYNSKLYFSSNHDISYYDLKTKKLVKIVNDIPNFGDYRDIFINIRNGYLYASIGSSTNNGVVGKDNKWIKENPYTFDVTPKNITLKGINFGDEMTGAFVPYNTPNIKGQIIPGHFPGNGSIIIYNINTKAAETFAWGIRNVSGMDFDKSGKLIAAVGGMEDRGVRPVKGDNDYIYEIDKDKWYGWPDYSGGDPVDSPKFKNRNKRLLDKVPNINPPAPLYEYDKVGSLGVLTVDKNSVLGIKNCIFVYDKNDNSIIKISGSVKDEFVHFTNKSFVNAMHIFDDGMYILDSKEGCLLQVYKGASNENILVDKKIIYSLICIMGVSSLIIIIFGFKKN